MCCCWLLARAVSCVLYCTTVIIKSQLSPSTVVCRRAADVWHVPCDVHGSLLGQPCLPFGAPCLLNPHYRYKAMGAWHNVPVLLACLQGSYYDLNSCVLC